MIRTGDQYRESIRDGREVWIDGEKVDDVTTHPAFKPIVDIRARIYDLAHEDATRDVMTYVDQESGEDCATGSKPPRSRQDWSQKRKGVEVVLNEARGVVTRVAHFADELATSLGEGRLSMRVRGDRDKAACFEKG